MGRAIDSLWVIVRVTDNSRHPDCVWLSDEVDRVLGLMDSTVEPHVIRTMICRNVDRDTEDIDKVIGPSTMTKAIHDIVG